MTRYVFDETANLCVAYETDCDGAWVLLDECHYFDSDIIPAPSDFCLDSKEELVKYLEDIVYEFLDDLAKDEEDSVAYEQYLDEKSFAEDYFSR